jgi:hypothetical protein
MGRKRLSVDGQAILSGERKVQNEECRARENLEPSSNGMDWWIGGLVGWSDGMLRLD